MSLLLTFYGPSIEQDTEIILDSWKESQRCERDSLNDDHRLSTCPPNIGFLSLLRADTFPHSSRRQCKILVQLLWFSSNSRNSKWHLFFFFFNHIQIWLLLVWTPAYQKDKPSQNLKKRYSMISRYRAHKHILGFGKNTRFPEHQQHAATLNMCAWQEP